MGYLCIKCPLCESSFSQEVRFRTHLDDEHNVQDVERLYVDTFCNGVRPLCSCGCGTAVKWYGWKKGHTSKYCRGHNASFDTVFAIPERAKEFALKRAEGYRLGRYKVWNDGLTAQSSETIAEASRKTSITLREGYASGSIVDWRTLDPEKARIAAAKSSKTKKKRHELGEVKPWNKGLTKHDCESLRRVGEKCSVYFQQREAGRRLSVDEVKRRLSLIDGFELIGSAETYRNVHESLDFRCLKCGRVSSRPFMVFVSSPRCFYCHPRESFAQLELFEFVRALAGDAVLSERSIIAPKEIDVYVPSKRFGIEFDGLYWHSEKYANHLSADSKVSACDAANVSLLRVFEDEWRNKRHIVESIIKHRLHVFDRSVGARKCNVEALDRRVRKDFIDRCHIDGDVRAVASWGLINEGNIVAVLSIRIPFHRSLTQYAEVARYCVASGLSVPGALSRLSKVALAWAKEHGKVGLMTYVDRRIGNAKGYVASGFKVIRETKQRFWWTDYVNRYDRFSIRADSKSGITQEDAAASAGVVKIWGCRNLVLILI